ncbi:MULTISPECIES: hypothetical protein [Butyricimonas]|uniref:hypothetical protein n=1 Tax=Butyricimonas TaxID=574697 RepID=UPI000C070083|nr:MULTISPECIES: hypothetical protein [Butyricimonas]MCB6973766.1 hypothetical protein [Butyricimonas synergistica]MCG4520577.1 hypothetical protein [Butyricimonas sp. DFI.6.44]
MRFLLCPQCGIRRFHVKDAQGNPCLVQVTTDYEVVPVNENDSLEGFDTTILYCLGCSWSGSPKSLKRY